MPHALTESRAGRPVAGDVRLAQNTIAADGRALSWLGRGGGGATWQDVGWTPGMGR